MEVPYQIAVVVAAAFRPKLGYHHDLFSLFIHKMRLDANRKITGK